MTSNHLQKAWADVADIIAVIAVSTWLVIAGVLPWYVLIFVAFGCLPWAKHVWLVAVCEYLNPQLILPRLLPKIGFAIENTEWNDNKILPSIQRQCKV